MEAGFARRDEASSFIADTCLLADKLGCTPSEVYRWGSRDRVLMLAYYEQKAKILKQESRG